MSHDWKTLVEASISKNLEKRQKDHTQPKDFSVNQHNDSVDTEVEVQESTREASPFEIISAVRKGVKASNAKSASATAAKNRAKNAKHKAAMDAQKRQIQSSKMNTQAARAREQEAKARERERAAKQRQKEAEKRRSQNS